MGQMRDFIVSLFSGGSVGLILHDALVYVLAYLPVLIISIIASTRWSATFIKKSKTERGAAMPMRHLC